jgi:hypothetical protein
MTPRSDHEREVTIDQEDHDETAASPPRARCSRRPRSGRIEHLRRSERQRSALHLQRPSDGRCRQLADGLRRHLGRQPGKSQQFAVGNNTQYIRWTNGVPTVVPESNLVAGDRVSVRVRSPRRSSLAQIEATAAGRVADSGPNPGFAHKPLWLFIGKLDGPASGGHLTLHIANGNQRALQRMLGQPLDQTFSYDAHTIFVLWQGGVPTLISPSQLVVGDRISVRIRARASASLGQVESTPANHVGDHEPAA